MHGPQPACPLRGNLGAREARRQSAQHVALDRGERGRRGLGPGLGPGVQGERVLAEQGAAGDAQVQGQGAPEQHPEAIGEHLIPAEVGAKIRLAEQLQALSRR